MRIFVENFRGAVRGLLVPFVGAVLLCLLCLRLVPHQAETGVDRAAGQWLHLPGLLLVAAALGAALEGWPLFSRARPGFAWILRVEGRPLHGCLAATLGSLAALTLALVFAGLAFSGMLRLFEFDQGDVRRRAPVDLRQERPYLDHRQDTLVFVPGDREPTGSIRLRPDAFFSGRDVRPAQIEVLVDGARLHPGWIENAGEPIHFDIRPPRTVGTIEVRRKPGPGLLLRLPPDRLEVVSSIPRSALLNCILALLTYLVPAAMAFAVMIAGHRLLALPVNFAAGLVTCLLATLLELTPTAAAITSFARGAWLLGEGGLETNGLWGLAGAAGLIAAAWLGHRLALRFK